MKKLIITALALGVLALNTNAQVARKVDPSQKVQRDATHKRDGQMNGLDLTADQKKQIKENREFTKQQREAILSDAGLTADQRKEKLQQLQKSQKDKMSSILTANQKAKMKANKKDWKHDGKMRGKKDEGKWKDLNLTDVQKTQMKANREAINEQREAIKNDASLSQEQKKVKMQELHKAQKDKMNAILTADQKAKMQADKKNWKQHSDKGKGDKKMRTDSSKSNA